MSELTLYTRHGCPLCEDMQREVEARLPAGALRLVDVDADPVLAARFGWDVPLLFAGEAEICRHRLDSGAFSRWLAGRG